jgi:hypothetical protein
MRVVASLFFMLALLIGGVASAQEAKGWLGADVVDVTKAEADKLNWDAPHGAKVGVVATGSPADKAGLKSGDIIAVVDGVEVEASADFERIVAAKPPGADIRLRVMSNGRARRVTATLAERPKRPSFASPTGRRVALVVGINAYENLEQRSQLKKARADSEAVARAFKSLGFDVIQKSDLARSEFNAVWQEFLEQLASDDTAVFYFAGHGVEIANQNYLISGRRRPNSHITSRLRPASRSSRRLDCTRLRWP